MRTGGLVASTLVALVEPDILVARDAALLAVTRELALVAEDTVLARIGTAASGAAASCPFSSDLMETVRVRGLGSGGVLLLLSILAFVASLAGVDEVAEIVLVRAARPGDGPGLRVLLLAVGALGLRRGAEDEDGTPLGPAAEGLVGFSVASESVLRLVRGLNVVRRRAGLSPGLSLRYLGHEK